jgi:hypothetical protein
MSEIWFRNTLAGEKSTGNFAAETSHESFRKIDDLVNYL